MPPAARPRNSLRVGSCAMALAPPLHSLQLLQQSGSLIEVRDHFVPRQQHGPQPLPEGLITPRLKVIYRNALLLDPRVVAKIEDAVAVAQAQLLQVSY